MKVFFTSDLHFYHRNIIRLCNRPFATVEEMNAELIRRWNEVVGPDDVVFVLGDVFFCGIQKSREIIDQLQGFKVLIKGNHDRHSLKKLNELFSHVRTEFDMTIAGEHVMLSHYPYAPTKWQQFKYKLKNFWKVWRKQKYMALRYMERRPENLGGWLLHGHVHTAWQVKGKMINVGVDQWDFRPVPMERIERIIKESAKIK